ncbi:hypothetical protein [Hyphomonas sp.]|uniref:hypothetical protein n=1 Tax=Hyphomonas sp. TaxID=87 RepID=UPI0025C4A50E|nr:hypothetical protein [Hyphomonas sp.]
MDKQIYTGGNLLWLDDNFLDADYRGEDSDLKVWQRSLSTTDHRINRLLNLAIFPVTCLEEFNEALDDYLNGPERYSRFLFGVIDLRVPEHRPPVEGATPDPDCDYEPRIRNGVAAAERLAKHGIPFIFLSSASEGQKSLISVGLQGRPYFQKERRGRGSIMPQDAARYILQEFRANIGWLDLSRIAERMNLMRTAKSDAERFSISYFPFFGAHRDFVERWELRSEYVRSCNRIALRSPRSHSRNFILQCVCLAVERSHRNAPRHIEYLESVEATPAILEEFRSRRDNSVLVVRFCGEDEFSKKRTSSQYDHEEVLMSRVIEMFPRNKVVFVLPPDDSSDMLLSRLGMVPGVFYDDLPETRLQDASAREELLKRASRFVLHNLVGRAIEKSSAGGVRMQIDSVFLENPELLIDPINWDFLLEADRVAEKISDPNEILTELFESALTIMDWAEDEALAELPARLADGRPVPPERLFKTARSVLEEGGQKEHLPLWTVRAFHNWLVKSWNTPYGCVPEGHKHEADWAEHSLVIARHLATEAKPYISKPDRRILDRFPEEVIENLNRAAELLLDPPIETLLAREGNVDWEGFERHRWPHSVFPVSTHLNDRLHIDGGRYFFPHANELDAATVLFDGRMALNRLELRARFYRQRMDWAKRVLTQLPAAWARPLSHLLSSIEERKLAVEWNETRRNRMWNAMMAFQRNAVRISYIMYSVANAEGYRSKKDIDRAASKMRSAQSPKPFLEKIRGNRAVTFPALIVPNEVQFWNEQVEVVNGAMDQIRLIGRVQQATAEAEGTDFISNLFMSLHDGLLSSGDTPLKAADLIRFMYQPEFGMQDTLKAFPDVSDFAGRNAYDKLTSFAFQSDMLLAAAATGASLNQALRPILYADGYHFLSMLYDRRNMDKATAPDLIPAARNQLLEFFLYGLEGLAQQLKFVLYAAGHEAQASAIDDGLFRLARIPEANPEVLKQFLLLEEAEEGGYMVYTPGHEGQDTVKRFVYADYVDGVIHTRKHKS